MQFKREETDRNTHQLSLALLQSLLVQSSLPRHGEPRVWTGAEEGEVGAALVETLECLLQLHLGAVVVSLDHVVDLVQPLLQLLSDPGQGVAGVHPPPMVRLEGSDVQAGLIRYLVICFSTLETQLKNIYCLAS